jgi:hypothetical protein
MYGSRPGWIDSPPAPRSARRPERDTAPASAYISAVRQAGEQHPSAPGDSPSPPRSASSSNAACLSLARVRSPASRRVINSDRTKVPAAHHRGSGMGTARWLRGEPPRRRSRCRRKSTGPRCRTTRSRPRAPPATACDCLSVNEWAITSVSGSGRDWRRRRPAATWSWASSTASPRFRWSYRVCRSSHVQ